MKEPLLYIIEMFVCSGVFVAVYRLLIAGKLSFGYSRGYLLSSMLASAVIPLLNIPILPAKTVYISVPVISASEATIETIAVSNTLSAEAVFGWIYAITTILLITLMIWEMVRVLGFRRDAEHSCENGYDTYTCSRVNSPFSFLRSIYLCRGLDESDRKEIIAHETNHIRHHHSYERIVMNVHRALMWFNPFVWISYRDLIEVHEYEADRDSLKGGYDITLYRKLILKQQLGYNPDITCSLNSSLTKKRFIMMTKQTVSRYALLRKATIIPAIGLLMMLFSFTNKPTQIVEDNQMATTEAATTSDSFVGNDTDPTLLNDKKILFLVDGKEVSNIDNLKPEEISSVTVLKDKKAIEPYGEKASDGVIIVTTKSQAQYQGEIDEIKVVGYGQPESSPETKQPMNISISRSETGNETTLTGKVISIKSTQSITDAEKPIYVIDGKISNTAEVSPEQIESISVLKNESAVEIYGQEGKNGVIIITTKAKAAADKQKTTVKAQQNDKDVPFIYAEQMPKFDGGDLSRFRNWVMTNIKYPAEAMKNKVEGRVVVQFIVNKDGKVSDITSLESPNKDLSDEIERVVKSSPKWEPGTQRGEAVNVKYTLPIEFKLNQ